MSVPRFKKVVIGELINDIAPAPMNTFSAVGDINRDGRPDLVVCGRNGKMAWLENQGADRAWTLHRVDEPDQMECGGSLVDLTGNGLLDILNGGDWRSDGIFWWENPGLSALAVPWQRRLIACTGHGQFHDTLVGKVGGDEHLSLLFTNQGGGTNLYCVPIPADPTVSPWPGLQVLASGLTETNPGRADGRQPEEGLAIGDLDGDGQNEIVCGTHWLKYRLASQWEMHKFASGYMTTKIAIGDLDGDGKNEIVLSEGDPCVYGRTQGGKLAWFKPGADITQPWQEHLIEDYLLDAHSLQLANLSGNGRLDIFTAEVGVADSQTDAYISRPPRLLIYENDGQGGFQRHIIDEGTGTHEAVLVDMLGRGRLDIAGKPLHGPEKWKIHIWFNEG